MIQFKIFSGVIGKVKADDKVNQWLNEHPNIEILDMKYQQARYGDHSICIVYKELKRKG